MKLDWKIGLGLAVSAFFLWWTFRGEDLGVIGSRLASANFGWLLAAGAISTAGGLIRALRWNLLLGPVGVETSLYTRWTSLNIGFMVTNVYPARLGEIVRPYALSRMSPVSMSSALGTIVLERVLDAIALLLLLIVALLSPAFPDDATVLGRSIEYAVSGAIIFSVVALVSLSLIIRWPARVTSFVRWFARILPGHVQDGLTTQLESFLSGLDLLRRPVAMLQALLWSLAVWIWMAASFWVGFRAFDIDLGVTAAIFTQCAVSMFVAIPAAPGFIGTLQAGVAVSVQDVFGVAAEPTLSLAIGYHIAGFVPVTLLGLYYASKLGIRLGSIESEAEEALEDTQPPPH
ncbi:MAG TPA: flippase-like domain-containing protein [Gemmatimonadetes bacterium]|nr:flippase-like domain-containing protein [Gemmatimonadota bacterium]